MKSKLDKLLKSQETAVILPILGFGVWIIGFAFLFSFFDETEVKTITRTIYELCFYVWSLFPLISVVGIIAGFRHISNHRFCITTMVAILFNFIFLLCSPLLLLIVFFVSV